VIALRRPIIGQTERSFDRVLRAILDVHRSVVDVETVQEAPLR